MLNKNILSLTRLILVPLCLVGGQLAFAANAEENKIISCADPETGQRYFTNIKSSVPENCENSETFSIPDYKQPSEDSGLRASEKIQLQEMAVQEEKLNQANFNRTQQVDEKVGLGVYGSWQDYRQNQCFAYKERVAEAQADRKDDVKLNRQIQRDLKQIEYYCR